MNMQINRQQLAVGPFSLFVILALMHLQANEVPASVGHFGM
jgi:hypothetical protein